MELFSNNGQKELHGVIYLADVKNKNFETVKYFDENCIKYVRELGYPIVRYNEISDGCSSQYWCYGLFHHLETMTIDLNIPNINFHCYEPYEGNSFSDTLGPSETKNAKGSIAKSGVNIAIMMRT